MTNKRGCGILLHITSLPSPYGIGDMGKDAYDFVDFLFRSAQGFWQILPLNPVGSDGSPYQSFSAFAGNHLLISLEKLINQGLLKKEDIGLIPEFSISRVEYDKIQAFKDGIIRKAFSRFQGSNSHEYKYFINKNNYWLADYALFMALKKHFNYRPWNQWDKAIAFREKNAMQYYRESLKNEIDFHKFNQFIFFQQWHEFKKYANSKGIKIIGDLPIFVSHDSSDVWAYPELFQLDKSGNPLLIAGVPPDYFSKTGQLWNNPIYRWDVMERDDYRWWRLRISKLLEEVDIIRLDHFRGFKSCWGVPAGEETAIKGKWINGPGENFFDIVEKYLGHIPVIAEDLGFITPDVVRMKNRFNYPGMEIIQFQLASGRAEAFLPENYSLNTVIYTGTHDNDTFLGWYRKNRVNPEWADLFNNYLGVNTLKSEEDICWRLIEFAYQTPCFLVIIPLQDVLCLGSEARMNYPGTTEGNWGWRFLKVSLKSEIEIKMADLAICHQRNN